MKLLFLHGPAVNLSRQRLSLVKSQFEAADVLVFEKGSDPQTMMGNLMTPSLLSKEQLIVLENAPELDLSALSDNLTVVFWFDKEINEKNKLLNFVRENKGQVLYFAPEKETSVFPFLDRIAARDKQAFLEIKKIKQAGFDSQYLITMILYQLRSLVATKKDAKVFVKEKVARQRKNFTLEELVDLYRFVLATDFKIKTGLIENTQAEFLIVNKFVLTKG